MLYSLIRFDIKTNTCPIFTSRSPTTRNAEKANDFEPKYNRIIKKSEHILFFFSSSLHYFALRGLIYVHCAYTACKELQRCGQDSECFGWYAVTKVVVDAILYFFFVFLFAAIIALGVDQIETIILV